LETTGERQCFFKPAGLSPRKSLNEKHKERDELRNGSQDAHNWHEHTYRWTAAISGNQDNPVWDTKTMHEAPYGLEDETHSRHAIWSHPTLHLPEIEGGL